MSYQDLMKKRDYSLANPQATIEVKEVTVLSSRSTASLGAYLTLENIDFDKDRGFVWSGDVGVGVSGYQYTKGEQGCNGIYVGTTLDENNCFRTWFHIQIKKGTKPKVAPNITSICGNRYDEEVRVRNCQDSVERACFQDMGPLFEDYFWNFLRAAYNNAASDGKIVQQIEELALEEAVSSYLRGLIAAYNDSFFRNRGALEERGALLGYYSSQQRYDICVSDENFQRAVDAQKRFLEMRLDNNLGFLVKNFMGDEAKCFLYRVDALQEGFWHVLKEFGWRLAPTKTATGYTEHKSTFSGRAAKDFAKLYKTLTDDFFTKEEKARIRTLEKAIFTGDKTARAAYDSLVGEIKGRYLSDLEEIQQVYHRFYACGLDDKSMDKYLGYRALHLSRLDRGIAVIDIWLKIARKNFESLGYELKGAPAEKKKQEFERQIGRLLSVSTYVDKDGREREMTLLDRCGQVILEKAEAIEGMEDAAWKKKEYELLIKDVEALREFQYLIGVYGKNKATLLDDGGAAYRETDSSGSGSFGEFSDFLSTDAYLDKLYAKINGGSLGYSNAGGGAWNDGESELSMQKILKIGLAVIIVLFILRTCGRIF